MKPTEQQQILEAIAILDRFAEKTSAPIDRQWHANWQAVYMQVVNRVQAISEKATRKEETVDENQH